MKRLLIPIVTAVLIIVGALAYDSQGQGADPLHPPGVLFHGEFNGTGADTPASEIAARFDLYEAGTGAAIVLAATDRIVITDCQTICNTSANVIQIFDGADTTVNDGERIFHAISGSVGTNAQVVFSTPRVLAAGSYPKLRNSAATQVDASIHGYVVRKGTGL